jgi:ABC-type lipoprotein export system ATPase subunit
VKTEGQPPLLSARGLRKSWGAGPPLLDDLDLRLDPGGHVLVLGPSGCGKSTLLHVIARLVAPDAGALEFRGTPYSSLPAPEPWRLRHVGIVFQDVHLLEALRVEQNVEIVQLSVPIEDSASLPSIEELLGPLELLPRRRAPARVLSRGERQRVGIARAFCNRPALVLADEPTASLDPAHRDATLDHLFALCARFGSTALLVSHDEAVARRPELARVLRIVDGRCADSTRPDRRVI